MTAVYLKTNELNNETVEAFYQCLRDLHGSLYADFVIGPPKEIVVETYDTTRLQKSAETKTCMECQKPILPNEEDDHLWEYDNETDGTGKFYLCCGCENAFCLRDPSLD